MSRDNYHTIQELKDHVKALGGEPAKTLGELYTQRTELSIALFSRQEGRKWKFVSEPGWFAYGWEHPALGPMGYHAPIEYWGKYDAPETEPFSIDGNTLERLVKFNFGNQHRDKFPSLR
jgi:hypothetical protein